MARVLMAAVATLSGAGPLTPARGDVVAYWNFNSYTTGSTLGRLDSIAPAQGAGTLTIGGGSPVLSFNTSLVSPANGTVGAFTGTPLNSLESASVNGALAVIGGIGSVTTNGGWVQFAISMTGLQDLEVSFATRGTSTGHRAGQLSWSTDGTSFTNFGAAWDGGASSSFFLVQRDLSGISALNDAANVFVRLTLSGATGTSGNNRIDNVQFNATPLVIPLPPAAWAGLSTMAGVVGFVAIRRRRHLA